MLVDHNTQAFCKVICQKRVPSFDVIEQLMHQYNVNFAVIDAQPEYRNSILFTNKFYGRAKACFYAPSGTRMVRENKDTSEATITVDRTAWLDLSLGRIKAKTISFPMDIDLEYRAHLKSLIRVYNKDKHDNPVGAYVKDENDPDHYAHARNYCELALVFALGAGKSHDIGKVL